MFIGLVTLVESVVCLRSSRVYSLVCDLVGYAVLPGLWSGLVCCLSLGLVWSVLPRDQPVDPFETQWLSSLPPGQPLPEDSKDT